MGGKKAIILAPHGYLTAGRTIEEATYLSVYLERAARMQIRARTFGPLTPVDDALAKEAHDYVLQPSIVKATFDYWGRQTHGAAPPRAGRLIARARKQRAARLIMSKGCETQGCDGTGLCSAVQQRIAEIGDVRCLPAARAASTQLFLALHG